MSIAPVFDFMNEIHSFWFVQSLRNPFNNIKQVAIPAGKVPVSEAKDEEIGNPRLESCWK
jgi:hypothetical protein